MKVNVKLFSIIRLRVGASELVLDMPDNSTVQHLLDSIEKEYEKELKNDFRSKNGNYYFSVKVNGHNSGFNVLLKDGDTVTLLTPVSGG